MNKIKYLEGVRGIFALLVVINHFIVAFYPALYFGNPAQAHSRYDISISKSPLFLLYNGNFAVCIFFVLSGFLIAHSFINKKSRLSLVASFIKRYFRLTIPIVVTNFIYLYFIQGKLFFNEKLVVITKSKGWLDIYLKSSDTPYQLFIHSIYNIYKDGWFGPNPVLWMMTFLFIGSAITYGFLLIAGNNKLRFVLYPLLIFFTWKTYYISFILGIILADLYNNKIAIKNKLILSSLFIISLFFGSFPVLSQGLYGFIKIKGIDNFVFYHILGAALFILVILNSTALQRIISNKILLFTGKISYSMFLIHFAVLGSFASWLFPKLSYSYNINFLITFSLSILLIYASSIVLYLLVESKCNLLLNLKLPKIKYVKEKATTV